MCTILLSLLISTSALAQHDIYGGWTKIKGKKTGFFHTEQINNRWWLVTPDGNAFFAKGVESIELSGNRNNPPADPQKEATKVAEQIKSWNFNCGGCWQRTRLPDMPFTVVLNLASSTTKDLWLLGLVPDYFSPEFREAVDRRAAEMIPPLVNDPLLIGYYTDNEIRWVPDSRSKETLLEVFLKKSPDSPGYQKAVALLKERGHTPETKTPDDMAAFLEIAAAQYGQIVNTAIRRHDKNHLIIGSRFNARAPIQLTRGLTPYYDVFSFNNYDHRAPLYKLREINRISGKPTMLTEFSFKAMDSGLYNSKGAGDAVATQQDRADLFTNYVEDLARLPSCMGFFWFQYRDQPKEGRGLDGENSNYGLVKNDGTPWKVLVAQMTKVNAGIEEIAAKAGK
jgi:agarase